MSKKDSDRKRKEKRGRRVRKEVGEEVVPMRSKIERGRERERESEETNEKLKK